MAGTLSKSDKNYKLIDSRNSLDPKHTKKDDKNSMKTLHNHISQN